MTDVVTYDEEILSVKGGRMVKDDHRPAEDEEAKREETRKACALRYLDGYPDTKVLPRMHDATICNCPVACDSRDPVQPEVCTRVCGARRPDTRAA